MGSASDSMENIKRMEERDKKRARDERVREIADGVKLAMRELEKEIKNVG